MRYLPVIFTLLLAVGCNSDYTHVLPNDYQLVRAYSGSSAIANPKGEVIVGPSKYGIVIAVSNHYILGNLDTEEKAFGAAEVPDRYFIIDTISSKFHSELSFNEFESLVANYNIEKFELKRPNKNSYE